ncbi:MAG TPA: hypothetical protein VGR26_06810, partial [Acidimicrobiales bacterium]|nr:hypothetical protein [Acidimicrobiales bacterium]
MGLQPLSNAALGMSDDRGWDGQAPLWFYVLKEAELQHGGTRLGEVGARIVAETLVGLLAQNRDTFFRLDPSWKPVPPIAPSEGRFGVPDLLAFSYSARSSGARAWRGPSKGHHDPPGVALDAWDIFVQAAGDGARAMDMQQRAIQSHHQTLDAFNSDLSVLVREVLRVWHPAVAVSWLSHANAYLHGARPMDVFVASGSEDVLDALRQTAAGSFP